MLSHSGPKNHGVVSRNVVAAIDAFFSARDWQGLWLTGGTCLAEYYFGHRVSIDIDLFTADSDLFQAARAAMQDPQLLGAVGELETVRVSPSFCQFLLRCRDGEVVKIDLVKDIPVCLDEKVKYGNVWLDSLLDLASNKMGCLVHREDSKDYVDLYYLLRHLGLGAREALDLGRKKEGGLDPIILAAQIQFLDSQPRPDFPMASVPWDEIRSFFRTLRKEVLKLARPPQ